MAILEPDPSEVAVERFASIAQPTRLQALRLLLSVYPESLGAGEVARRCEVPHNTMSTHLATLMRAGMIEAAKDGRAMNYRADLTGYRGLIDYLTRDCCGGHPELCAPTAPPFEETPTPDVLTPAFNVLFLCTHNSARSIIAEAVLERMGKGKFRAYSAGSDPGKAPLPEVIERLRQLGHDVGGLHCKSLDDFSGPDAPRMDFVIALCDTPEGQFCPDIDSRFVTGAWPLPDPARFDGSPVEKTTLLNELYAMIRRRIEIFVSLPFAALDRMALKARLDEIGDSTRISI
ncbi:helix-turn-helix domain-containing protein [Tardiphaga robiniae]|uniref:Protein-tyrosine-phosphatase n=1 Tax=Tardiphaga robiniae TaxID=943830 RepID=A0A163XQG9_9BRAD|nr:helix-turn-helix domain-containing protein [Tardiphaga robiniae]KZD21218.1 protein-tyrosine-phosphatase [Tardiphaga robiniae]